jgi:outer membrane protein insertion porin family
VNTFYTPVEPWTFRIGGEVGQINGLGEDTRILDRFFIGGRNVRGFAPSGLGPRDRGTGDALGAKRYYAGTVEAQTPLPLGDDFQIRGRLFTDFGAAWGVDSAPGGVLDSESPRLSVGAGASWRSPLGPIQFDLGFPIRSEDFDEKETFRFSFGTQF